MAFETWRFRWLEILHKVPLHKSLSGAGLEMFSKLVRFGFLRKDRVAD